MLQKQNFEKWRSSPNRYLIEAERLGYIRRDKDEIQLLNKKLFIVDEKSVYELTREYYPEIITDEDRAEHKIHCK